MSIENLTSQERAYLRGQANGLDAIFQLGKGGINDNFIKQIDDVLEVRELIKISLLETCEHTVKEAAEIICSKTGAQSVQMIGRKLVLYRAASDKDKRKVSLSKTKSR